jgi:hypothetical protein
VVKAYVDTVTACGAKYGVSVGHLEPSGCPGASFGTQGGPCDKPLGTDPVLGDAGCCYTACPIVGME